MKIINQYLKESRTIISDISYTENFFKVKLPKDYISFVINKDLDKDINGSVFKGHTEIPIHYFMSNSIKDKYSIVNTVKKYGTNFKKPKTSFALVPFVSILNGDMICFNYKNAFDKAPVVVLWDHDKALESSGNNMIKLLTKTFSEFIKKLK